MSKQDSSHFQQWWNEYESALLETNRKKLADKIVSAEAAIMNRLAALAPTADGQVERQAIEDALQNLRVLKRAELGGPSQNQDADAKAE